MAISEEVVKDWLKENYPDYADNLEFGKKLYKRIVLGGRNDQIIPINELEVDEWANVKGIVVAVLDPFEYQGCPVCLKKQCEHLATGQEMPTTLYIPVFVLMDESGELFVKGKPSPQLPSYNVGDELKIRGRLQIYNDKTSFSAWEVEILREAPKLLRMSPNAYRLLKDLEAVGVMRKAFFDKLLKSANVTWEEVEKYVEVKKVDGDEKVYPLKDKIAQITM